MSPYEKGNCLVRRTHNSSRWQRIATADVDLTQKSELAPRVRTLTTSQRVGQQRQRKEIRQRKQHNVERDEINAQNGMPNYLCTVCLNGKP